MAVIAGSKGRITVGPKGLNGAPLPWRAELAGRLLGGRATAEDALEAFENHARLREVSVEVNLACNLKCRYCYLSERTKVADLPLEVLEMRLEEGVREGVDLFAVVGKEPFFGDRGVRVLQKLDALAGVRPFRYGVVTNGTLVPRWKDQLAELRRMSYADISVDGLADENDALRGAGSFARALQGYEVFRALPGVQTVFLASALHKRNVPQLGAYVETMAVHGATSLHFAPVQNFTSDPALDPLLLDGAEFVNAIEILGEMAERLDVRGDRQLVLEVPAEYVWFLLGTGRLPLDDVREDEGGLLYVQPRPGLSFFLKLRLFSSYFWNLARVTHDGWFLTELDSLAWANEQKAVGNVRDASFAELFARSRRQDGLFARYYGWQIPRLVRIAEAGSLSGLEPAATSWGRAMASPTPRVVAA